MGQRAGLVERDLLDRGKGLEGVPALEQHAASRSAAERRDDRHRRRDDQRTGAGDHEQDKGAVNPVRVTIEDQTPNRQGHCAEDNDRGVDCRESLHQRLHRSFRLVRSLDKVDNPAHRRVRSRRCGPNGQTAVAIHAPGDHVAARFYISRDGLPGDCRLVERGGSCEHDAVDRHSLAGQDIDGVSARYVLNRHRLDRAISVNPRSGRSNGHQLANCAARPVDCRRLQRQTKREQHHERARFSPVLEGNRPDGSDRHQEVHVGTADPD